MAVAEVERIEEVTANEVRAGGIVATIWQAVHELLANSIDAGATSVEIKIDLPCYRFSVSDDGCGIAADKLRDLVGTQRATSKAKCSQDMQTACSYGFRGEALLSLGLTSMVEVQSRCEGRDARAKVVRGGQMLHFGPANAPLRTGTVVTVRDAFFKWPVRRKAINEATEMIHIKDQVAKMALVHNFVSITLVDSSKSKPVLRVAATGSVVRTFAQVFASDKLSMARKIAFEFKQFRITGYLSPPSSTAGHWSKEFQMVYVNRRCVRRLDFMQKAINAAFAPCFALLAGRGGSDGQGMARRARDPNASSGKRQELFPVFLLNLECPRSEVDVMAEPDKTLVEFCDWPSARNAPIALLLAFLPHFPHAVPTTVLRDLRRAFHKNEGGEKWTTASPPASISRAARASPDPPLSPPPPTPSPMRLAMPDVGVPSPLYGCDDWMGRDRESGGIFERDTERVAFQDIEISVEGATHPSPVSRFGACDSWAATYAMDSFRHVGGDLAGVEVSSHFRGDVVAGVDHDGWDARSAGDSNFNCSPYFDRFDRRSLADGVRDLPPRRHSLGRRLDEIPIGDRLDCDSDFREAESFPSKVVSSYLWKDLVAAGEVDAEMELESLAPEARNIRYLTETESGDWATEATAVFPDNGLPPACSSFDQSLTNREVCEERRPGRASPTQAGAVRDNLRGSWLRIFPGSSEEMVRSGAGVNDCVMDAAAEGEGGGWDLSRLFDFAFTNKDRRQVQEQPNRQNGRSRNGRALTMEVGEKVETCSTAAPTAGASEAEHDARSLSSSPRLPLTSEGSPVSASAIQALVGVTVRRPPSPQFNFMSKDPSPSRFLPPSSAQRAEKQEDETTARDCGSEAKGEAHNSVKEKNCEGTDVPSDCQVAAARMSKEGVASRGREDNSVPQTEDVSNSTPRRRTKRIRPDWSETVGKGASADVVSARWKPPPVSLPVSKRLRVETLEHRRMKADQGATSIRDRRPPVGNDEICMADGWVDWTRSGRRRRHGWWGLDVSTTPGGDEREPQPSIGAVRSQGDVEAEEVGEENRSNMADESRDMERCSAEVRDRLPSDDTDNALELGVEQTTCRPEILDDTEVKGGGLLSDDGQQHMTKHRGGLGTEGMAHDAQGAEALCRITSPDPTSDNLASDAGARKSPRTPGPVRAADVALAYDRDVLGGDGLADDTVDCLGSGEGNLFDTSSPPEGFDTQVSDLGGSAVSPPRGFGGIRSHRFGGSMELLSDSHSSRLGEKPISKVLESGQDEVGAGAGAVAVTITPDELQRSCVIGQADRKFIILRALTGAILCVDQHAADERIKLEKLERQVLGADRNSRNIEKLVLTPPEALNITSSDGELLEQHRKVLLSWHFDVTVEKLEGKDVGAPRATLLAVPVVCGVRLSAKDLLGFLRYLRENVEPGSSPRWLKPPHVQHILNYKACHSAIRFGDFLSRSACVDLIHKLALCARPFSCAHGRPSVVPLCVLGRATTAVIGASLKKEQRIRKMDKKGAIGEHERMSS